MNGWVLAWMWHMVGFGSNMYQMHRWVLAIYAYGRIW